MIRIEDLHKEFKVYRNRKGMVRELFGLARAERDYDLVRSLRGINLTIGQGRVHGIIGMNGAGKSTLLKILTGVLHPTSGRFHMEGRVAALLELGTGFHGELSGRENVRLNASIMGLERHEIEDKIPEIEAFAELGEFFDRPVKIYSSGMYVRLAFSFAISVDPDVLIIDEALSVGDAYFQQKCLRKIQTFKEAGTTILFVSHDLGALKSLCEEITLLSRGEVLFTGNPLQALDLYNALLAEHKSEQLIHERRDQARHATSSTSFESGNRDFEISSVRLLDRSGRSVTAVTAGSPVTIEVSALVNRGPIDNPTCGILIKDRLGFDIFGTNSNCLGVSTGNWETGQKCTFRFDTELNTGTGDFTLSVALHSGRTHTEDHYHWMDRALLFQVIPSLDFEYTGAAKLPVTMTWSRKSRPATGQPTEGQS